MLDIQKQLPDYVLDVLDVLEQHGRRGYLVGGSLRDLLRGVAPHDFDLTTNATPDEMRQVFKDYRVIETGLAHGTLTVLSAGHPIEITTHRTDGTYTDSRHPDRVEFTTDLVADLARRDFTVNAMAWSEKTGLVDPFDGQNDLRDKILRAVGDAETRFTEDALRIMRCFRFAAQLDFVIDPETEKGAKATAARLSGIAVERIFAELTRTVASPSPEKGLLGLANAGCFPYVFFDTVPDLSRVPALAELPAEAPLRLAALLFAHAPEALLALGRHWHAPNAFTEALCAYVTAAGEDIPTTPYEARRFVCRHFPHYENALLLKGAIDAAPVTEAIDLTRTVKKNGTAVEIRRLAVNGRELQEKVGVKAEKTAALLARLQDLVWQDPQQNRRDALLAAARPICEKENWL